MYIFFKEQFKKILAYVLLLFVLKILGEMIIISESNFTVLLSLVNFIFITFITKTWIYDYKKKNDKDLEKFKGEIKNYNLVTKLQYDLEFKIYLELSEVINNLYSNVYSQEMELKNLIDLKEDIAKNGEKIKNKIKICQQLDIDFRDKWNNLVEKKNKYRPFFEKHIYLKVDEIHQKILNVDSFFEKENSKEVFDKLNKIDIDIEELSDLIRKRIESMKII